jgi:hypothetical protein
MKKQRKHYTPEEKVAILRRHLVEGVPISDLFDERGLLRPSGSEVGNGEGTAEESPPAGHVTDETDCFRLADKPPRIDVASSWRWCLPGV